MDDIPRIYLCFNLCLALIYSNMAKAINITYDFYKHL